MAGKLLRGALSGLIGLLPFLCGSSSPEIISNPKYALEINNLPQQAQVKTQKTLGDFSEFKLNFSLLNLNFPSMAGSLKVDAVDSFDAFNPRPPVRVGKLRFADYRATFNKRPRTQPITTIVVHYTATEDFEKTIQAFQNPYFPASIHYIINRDGSIVRMIPDNYVSFHACEYNDTSIGIEIMNCAYQTKFSGGKEGECKCDGGKYVEFDKVEFWERMTAPFSNYNWVQRKELLDKTRHTWEMYPYEQMQAAALLTRDLAIKYHVPFENIVPHSSIEVEKFDVGPAFDEDYFMHIVKTGDFNYPCRWGY